MIQPLETNFDKNATKFSVPFEERSVNFVEKSAFCLVFNFTFAH